MNNWLISDFLFFFFGKLLTLRLDLIMYEKIDNDRDFSLNFRDGGMLLERYAPPVTEHVPLHSKSLKM